MKNFIKREMATHRAFYDLEETNKKGEKISVEIMEIFLVLKIFLELMTAS